MSTVEIPITSRFVARVTVVTLLAAVLAGCAENWPTTTFDRRAACESFGGRYWENDGTCRGGGGP